jgi:hypothetical protein
MADIPCVDFMAIMTAGNWEPYLALILVTATGGDFAVGDTSVGLGPKEGNKLHPRIIATCICECIGVISKEFIPSHCQCTIERALFHVGTDPQLSLYTFHSPQPIIHYQGVQPDDRHPAGRSFHNVLLSSVRPHTVSL